MPINSEILQKYKQSKNIFIETGAWVGETVRLALDLGFKKVYTIEYDLTLYNAVVNRFSGAEGFYPYHGDSGVVLKDVLKNVDEPAVLWLDAHCGNNMCPLPLQKELETLKEHAINEHTILIDDVRTFGKDLSDVSVDIVTELLLGINPKYKISFEDDQFSEKDIIVAHIEDSL